MIADSSALFALVADEDEAPLIRAALRQRRHETLALSTATYVELGVVVDRRPDRSLPRRLDDLLDRLEVELVPFDAEQARVARQAYREFGRGSGHPARLNFGDCFSYALASVRREPLLFVGDHFIHTDLTSVL